MIANLQHDIFDTECTHAQAIIHQANCQCTMGSGIAKDIKARFPEAYEADCKTKKGDSSKLGRASIAPLSGANRLLYPNLLYIVNLYGQDTYGLEQRHTSYDALADGFERIYKWAVKRDVKRLTVPYRIGCNRAGGNWKIVLGIMDAVFGDDEDICLTVCENPAIGREVTNKESK
jgi:O-acetyl-ADP-ribose deacetylase (regulator of RNase III)